MKSFTAYDVNRLPNTVAELKVSPPSAWDRTMEQIVARSLSFSENEMLSQPTILLTVVASTDKDPVAAMQELTNIHNLPTCFSSGQFDPTIQRVFVLLDDNGEKKVDAFNVLRALTAQFPASHTKLLAINSFTKNALNLQQPDMWSRFMIPKYFAHHAPRSDPNELPINPTTQKPVLGARLSVEDFMKLREFCIWLFNEQIIPTLERRISNLSRQVNDSRKGMKNVLKNFWRKPRDEADSSRGGVKYRFDKIETQTLLLADTSFAIKDYETALIMYRLVKDDYKADKSILLYTHSLLMIALCQMFTEPHKYKEVYGVLDTISQCMLVGLDWPHAAAYLALLSAEIYVYHPNARSPLESARILLQASSSLAKYPLLSSLLIERSAVFYLQAYQVRKYVFHSVLAGTKYYKCGANPSIHATVCFAAAMLMMEKSNWGDMKVKLLRFLAQEFLSRTREGAQKSLIFILKTLYSVVSETKDVQYNSCLADAVNVLNNIIADNTWGIIHVRENWMNCTFRDIVEGKLPLGAVDITKEDISKSKAVVCGLAVPEVDMESVTILELVNGYNLHDMQHFTSDIRYDRDLQQILLDVEKQWIASSAAAASAGNSTNEEKSLEELLYRAEREYRNNMKNKSKSDLPLDPVKIPMYENVLVQLKMTNKLPTELQLKNVQLDTNNNDHFSIVNEELTLTSECARNVILKLIPKQSGRYEVESVRWSLSNHFSVIQPIHKKGPLLQRTMAQRANNERGKDRSLVFEVIDARPLITLHIEGISSEVLQGQLLQAHVTLTNEGSATAKNIFLKLNEPIMVFYLVEESVPGGKMLNFCGNSSTVIHLQDIVIAPNETLQLEAWIRFVNTGDQKLSLLASYETDLPSGSAVKNSSRNSFIWKEVSFFKQAIPFFILSIVSVYDRRKFCLVY